MTRNIVCTIILSAALTVHTIAGTTDTTFTYQGELRNNGEPATGSHDMSFSLWDELTGGAQVGSTVNMPGVVVTEGRFSVLLDMGASAFDNGSRWLEIAVAGFTLSPRQPITRTPYSIQTRGIFVDENNNVGIGTSEPDDRLHVRGTQPTLRLDDDSAPGSFTEIKDAGAGQLRINKTNISGQVLLDLNPKVTDGTSDVQIRFFRETNTTGPKIVQFLRGNFTTQTSARIGVDGQNSFFQAHGGNVGIGTTSPQAKLHIAGEDGIGLRVHQQVTESQFQQMDVQGTTINSSGNGFFGNPIFLNNASSNSISMVEGGGNVGIGGDSAGFPLVRLHVDGGIDASVSNPTSGYIVVGNPGAANIVIDNNEIMARDGGATSTLYLNHNGGDVRIGGTLDIGIEVVEEWCDNSLTCEAVCPSGKGALSGGCSTHCSNCNAITDSRPIWTDGGGVAPGWHCEQDGSENSTTRAWVVCGRIK